MAKFLILSPTRKGKSWSATGVNPLTGKRITLHGGQAGVDVGSKNPKGKKTFDARHEATPMTPKKYINKLRWNDKAQFGTTVNVPNSLFWKN